MRILLLRLGLLVFVVLLYGLLPGFVSLLLECSSGCGKFGVKVRMKGVWEIVVMIKIIGEGLVSVEWLGWGLKVGSGTFELLIVKIVQINIDEFI